MADKNGPIDQNELMMLQNYLQEYGQQAEIFVNQLQMLENGRLEAHAAIEALEAMLVAGDGTVLLQIGGGASVRAKSPGSRKGPARHWLRCDSRTP